MWKEKHEKHNEMGMSIFYYFFPELSFSLEQV